MSVHRSVFSLVRRDRIRVFVAFSLLFVLIVPSMVIPVKGRAINSLPAAERTLGRDFVSSVTAGKSPVSFELPLDLATSTLSNLPNPTKWFSMPEGLVIPNPPSFSQRVSGAFSNMLALVTPKVSAKPKAKKTNEAKVSDEESESERESETATNKAAAEAETETGTDTEEISEAMPLPTPVPGAISFDFDGDGKADVGRWHHENYEMKIRNSNGGSYTTYTLGSSTTAKPAPGDFTGDGKTDPGVFNAGTWTYKPSPSPSATPVTISLGTSGDIPVAGDYDGDGITDAAVFRPSTGDWHVKQSSNGSTVTTNYGVSTDIPIPGNYDGDAYTDEAVFRSGTWYLNRSTAGATSLSWGVSIDIPVQGDFDGDGKSDPAVWRPTDGTWYVLTSSSNYGSYTSYTWGNFGDQPTSADYDGDGITDYAVYRPTTGEWFVKKSSNGGEEYRILGVPGDIAVPSAYTKQAGAPVTGYELATVRTSPKNATGGTNLYSQNFSWATNLVSLPGRSGLDLNIGMGYNSLVWIKHGSSMIFDPDDSNVTPGFRFGFPMIEPIYYDSDKSKWVFMMVGPDGGRTEFRQTSASAVYETPDSSYVQLVTSGASNPNDPVEDITIKVYGTDGTNMYYEWLLGAYRCKEIKDRNGNYITIAYNADGRVNTVTDTLSRVVTFNYDSGGFPTTIKQNWKNDNGGGSTTLDHTWATFSYTTKTVDIAFDNGLTPYGAFDDQVIKVLDKIEKADGSYTKFEYNTYLQVKKIRNYSDNDTELNYTYTNLETVGGNPLDCPRMTSTKSWIRDFNGGSEIETTNTAPASDTYSLPGSLSGSSSSVKVKLVGHTDQSSQIYSLIHFSGSGWNEGQTLATEDCLGTDSDCATRKRWTWNDWTQDNTGLSYILNPRVTESRVGDGTNTRKTTIGYYSASGGYKLPESIAVGDTSTVLKTATTTYVTDSSYTSKRIIWLPSESKLFEGTTSGTLMSKVTYAYDEGNFSDSGLSQNISPTRHDGTNYGSGFTTGRGNLTSVTRWDATVPTTSGSAITKSIKYNTAGSPVAYITPFDATYSRTVMIGYADNYNSSPGVSTYAYPTTVSDPLATSLGDAAHSSTMKYRYDFGGVIESVATPRSGSTAEKKLVNTYDDDIGRITKSSLQKYAGSWSEHSYARFEYPASGRQLKRYDTLVDVDGDSNIAEDEALTDTWFDGAGRVYRMRRPHPGSSGGWSGVLTEYDLAGRVYRTSVPTEISVDGSDNWTAAGDDYSRGYVYNYSYYDWNNRVTRTVPSDSTGSDGKDTLIEYDGCGCAGGLVTTIKGPVTTAIDASGYAQTTKRRWQKSYDDVLGRKFKNEVWDLDGASIYSTVKSTLNGRDQATLIRQYVGSDSSGTYQDTTMSYDGHGRLYQSHKPEQRDGSTLKYTTYNYNRDDSILSATDGRGAVTTYTYENASGVPKRPLVTKLEWSVPGGSGISDPTDVAYTYDNAGNRTQMTDGLGTVSYTFDVLSQLQDETRDFTDTLADSPNGGNGQFKLEYSYHVGGHLKSYTDPWDEDIIYTKDKVGRLTSLTGSSFASVSTYANNPTYRAWGGLKHLEYGSGNEVNLTYNNRLQPLTYVASQISSPYTKTFDKTYEYNGDGGLKLIDEDVLNKFDRLFKYDHVGRMKEAKSGTEAHGVTETDLAYLPYRQIYTYNAFGNLTDRDSTMWDYGDWDFNYSITNNRVAGSGYDFDGREVTSLNQDGDTLSFIYDAAGRMIETERYYNKYETLLYHTGDGGQAKRSQRTYDTDLEEWEDWETAYFIRSSVLNRVVSEATATGKKKYTYVVGGGASVARQYVDGSNNEYVNWELTDPSGYSSRGVTGYKQEELDGLGNNVGIFAWPSPPPRMGNSMTPTQGVTFDDVTMGQCQLDGIVVPCSMATRSLRSGSATVDWNNTDPAALSGFGIVAIWNPTSGRQRPDLPDRPDNVDNLRINVQTDGGEWTYHFIESSRGPSVSEEVSNPQSGFCGINPVTGRPGIVDAASGIEGEVRPGVDGGGFFDSRRPKNSSGRHNAVDLSFGTNSVMGTIIEPGPQFGKDQYLHRGSIVAFGTGTVIERGYSAKGLGHYVVIDHNLGGLTSTYAHLAISSTLRPGDEVAMGDYIGIGGQTGNAQGQGLPGNSAGSTPLEAHLHFILKRNGTPIDPIKFLNNPCPAWLTPNSKRRR